MPRITKQQFLTQYPPTDITTLSKHPKPHAAIYIPQIAEL